LHWRDYPYARESKQNQISEYLASATGMLVEKLPIKAIIAFTEVGFSARIIAKHRPKCRIFVATTQEKTIRQLGLIWGCYPLIVKEYQNTDQMVVESVEKAKKMNYLNDEDTILIISHSVLCPGKTNLIHAYTVSDIPSLAEFNALQ